MDCILTYVRNLIRMFFSIKKVILLEKLKVSDILTNRVQKMITSNNFLQLTFYLIYLHSTHFRFQKVINFTFK